MKFDTMLQKIHFFARLSLCLPTIALKHYVAGDDQRGGHQLSGWITAA